MSQYGANEMAKQGNLYEDIVKYYYKDIDITILTKKDFQELAKK